MKLDRVKYSRYFKETEEWLGAEIQVEEGDNDPDVWQAAIWSVEAAYRKKWGQITPLPTLTQAPVINTERTSIEKEVRIARESILACTSLSELVTFKKIADRHLCLTEPYNTMYQKLASNVNKK